MTKKESKEGNEKKEAEEPYFSLHEIFDITGDKGYKKFVILMILIDLVWFFTVVADYLLGMKTSVYFDFFWVLLFAMGLLIISDVNKIWNIRHEGWHSENFANLITFVIGILAIITAFASLPSIHKSSPVFTAIKGILALIAIFYVVIETWLVKRK